MAQKHASLLAGPSGRAHRAAGRPYAGAGSRAAASFTSEAGLTPVELLVVMLLISILSVSAMSNLKVLERPLDDATQQTLAFLKQVRARGMSSTLAMTIAPDGEGRLSVTRSTDCGETADWDPASLLLPQEVVFTDTSWSLCFTARGLATSAPVIELADVQGRTKRIEVFLGGAARVQP